MDQGADFTAAKTCPAPSRAPLAAYNAAAHLLRRSEAEPALISQQFLRARVDHRDTPAVLTFTAAGIEIAAA
ncbi:hypothetical protein [Nocardia sp. SYP-A9097]|uniref:hypothetical protein n=1 Tax=Nocardia sp. SYP-A9097 TaxID=2663237 RepID=UPI00129BB61E|nr:hypothetical protein [Nocardia sp. SYP-A9097]